MDDKCICTALRQAAALGTAYYDAALAPCRIKVTMFRLLRRIDEAKAASISELAAIMGLDRSTLGRNLRVLEKQSLIRMTVGVDERSRLVELTDTGRTTLAAALPLWRSAQTEFAAMIGPATLAHLDRLAGLATENLPDSGVQT